MKRMTILLATAALLAATPAMADPDIKLLSRSGVWTAYVATTPSGPACGMSVVNNADTQSIHIKWYAEGTRKIVVQVFKTGWRIPKGTQINVELGFDGGSFGSAVANGGPSSQRNISYIEFNMGDTDTALDFIGEFREANKMWIKFPDGNEAPWVADMNGSRATSKTFGWCITQLDKRSPPMTSQPFGKDAPTQPFEKKPVIGKDRDA